MSEIKDSLAAKAIILNTHFDAAKMVFNEMQFEIECLNATIDKQAKIIEELKEVFNETEIYLNDVITTRFDDRAEAIAAKLHAISFSINKGVD